MLSERKRERERVISLLGGERERERELSLSTKEREREKKRTREQVPELGTCWRPRAPTVRNSLKHTRILAQRCRILVFVIEFFELLGTGFQKRCVLIELFLVLVLRPKPKVS